MLIARPAKRDNLGAFNRDMLYEIVEGDQPIGNLAFGIDTMRGAITLASKVYSVQRTSEGRDELLHEALIRAMKGGEPPKNPWTLKDDTGQVLALAERTYESFAVSRGGESFTFRKKWRPYHLSTARAASSPWAPSASGNSSPGCCTWTCRTSSIGRSRCSCWCCCSA